MHRVIVGMCGTQTLNGSRFFDLNEQSQRAAFVRAIEVTKARLDALVIIDGMAAVGVVISCIRIMAEADSDIRVTARGSMPPLGLYIDAWEASRLEELIAEGRLVIGSALEPDSRDAYIESWLEQ